MGFATGFTGGVTLTLSIAYLTVLAHRHNREAQSDFLRMQSHVLDGLSATPGRRQPPPPPTRAELAALARAGFLERTKDRWNSEVVGAARWAQSQDLDAIREGVEDAASRALNRVTGRNDAGAVVSESAGAVVRQGARAAEEASDVARRAAGVVAEESRSAGADAAGRARDAATSTAESTRGVVQRGLDIGKDLVGKARAAVGLDEAKAPGTTVAAVGANGGVSDVEKALRQRYEKTEDAMQKSVDELLQERYTPISQKDHTVLRGL